MAEKFKPHKMFSKSGIVNETTFVFLLKLKMKVEGPAIKEKFRKMSLNTRNGTLI